MAYRNIRTYVKPHTSDGDGGTNIYIGSNNNNLNTDNLSVINLNAINIDANKIKTRYIDADNANILYLMAENGQIKKLEGNELNFTSGHIGDLDTSSINTNTLNVNDSAVIKNTLTANNILSNNIVTDYLTVNKSAHFFELIIDKIRSVQGTQINTAANCIVDFVEAYDSNNNPIDVESNNVAYYRIYWKNTDDDGRAITNDWLVYDQALCESFNVDTGVSYDVSNKYYWRLVTNTDNGTPKYVNLSTGEVRNTLPSDYEITFPNRFKFGNASAHQWFTDFTIEEQSTLMNPSIINEWDDTNNLWTLNTTQFGLQLTAPDALLIHASFEFTTNIKTKLNIGVYYADGTFDYFPADTYKTSYSIETAESKNVEAIVILSSVIDKWDACNWIDLSNVDMDVTLSGKSAIPSAGDNVCQLGYRYDMLQNPTQDDISRASAIIIAAYKTPDTGIVPPSYAQYQGIGHESNYRWNLGHYRGSYFDATKAKFIGEFEVQAAGSTTPLEDYIKSFNNANPLEGFITTNNNQPVDLVVLQTDNSDKIYDLNNFPNNLQVMVTYEGNPQFDINDYDVLTLTLFDVTYDLKDGNSYTTNLPSGYQGIYLYSISKTQYQPFRLTFKFAGSEQIVTTSSMLLHAEISNGSDTYILNKSIPINSVSSVEGTDAEVWQLYKDTEIAVVKQDKSLDVQLRYAVEHIVGTTSTIVTPTNMMLRVRRYKLDGTILDTTIRDDSYYITTGGKTGNGYWQYTYNPPNYNWMTDPDKTIYIVVELLDSNYNILANTLVYIVLETSSALTVTNGLTESVQAHTTAITNAEGNITTLQNEYTDISQTVNSISSTVSNQQISINSMQTDISNISQTATNIALHVNSVETDLNTLETQIQTTGIDIEQGKITLTAENTDIQGNLNIHNANEGLVIYDNATNTPKIAIQGNSIGTLTDFYNNGSLVYSQFSTEAYLSSGTVSFPVVPIGVFNTNNKITVSIYTFRNENEDSTSITNVNYTYNLIKDNVVVSTNTGTATSAGTSSWDINIPEYIIPENASGQYKIQLTLTVTGGDNNDYFGVVIGIRQFLSIVQRIGTDGAFFGYDAYKLAWFGQDRHRIAFNNNYIEVNSTGVSYKPTNATIASEIGSTTTVHRCTSGTSYDATQNDGFITICPGTSESGGWFTVYLPFPSMVPGKIYYFKNYSGNDVRIGVGAGSDEKYMMSDDGTGTDNWRKPEDDSEFMISDGQYWICYDCHN